MDTKHASFIGIDLHPEKGRGKRRFTYVGLEDDLKLLVIGQGNLNDVLAYAGGQEQAFIAIGAPHRPAPVAEGEDPAQAKGRKFETLLHQDGLPVQLTPGSYESCPLWMRVGMDLFRRLEEFGYTTYPAGEGTRQLMEVNSTACFTSLLGLVPRDRTSLEGRMQRQMILNELGLEVPDPMGFFEEVTRYRLQRGILPFNIISLPSELDAMVNAYTAWKAALHAADTHRLGDPADGEIVLPVRELVLEPEPEE
jgi:hypothetical protein